MLELKFTLIDETVQFQINRIVIRNDQNQDLIRYLQQSLLTFTYQWMQAGFMLLVSALTEGI